MVGLNVNTDHYIARSMATAKDGKQFFHLSFNRKIGDTYYSVDGGKAIKINPDGSVQYKGIKVVEIAKKDHSAPAEYEITVTCKRSSFVLPIKTKFVKIFRAEVVSNRLIVKIKIESHDLSKTGDDDIIEYTDMPVERPLDEHPGKAASDDHHSPNRDIHNNGIKHVHVDLKENPAPPSDDNLLDKTGKKT